MLAEGKQAVARSSHLLRGGGGQSGPEACRVGVHCTRLKPSYRWTDSSIAT